jgi:hypothetical protein
MWIGQLMLQQVDVAAGLSHLPGWQLQPAKLQFCTCLLVEVRQSIGSMLLSVLCAETWQWCT